MLNVLRESPEDTPTTPEIAEQLPIRKRATQNYVRELEKKGRLVLESEGRPNHWRLSDTEPQEPVYREEYAKARRWANKSSKLGDKLFVAALGFLASIGLVTTSNVWALELSTPLHLFQGSGPVIVGGFVGLFGVILFLGAFVAHFVSITLPREVEWSLDGKLPDED